jgi:hypothetical protein
MKITPGMKKILLEEIEFALEKMRSTQVPAQKLYYFSAIYGCINRIINIEFDSELVFVHHVLSTVYIQLNSVVSAAGKQGGVITIPDNLFNTLEDAIADISLCLKKNINLYNVLERFSNIAYSTTGNGYYMYLKGKLEK